MKNFLSIHPCYKQDDTNTLPEPASTIPDDLAALLHQQNANSYASGFINFVAPDKFRHYFPLWGLNKTECFPFIKLAFGHMIFYHQSMYKVLNPVYNCIDLLGSRDDLDFVMNTICCDRVCLENSFFIDVYEQTWKNLKPVSIHEMYAFVPALRLGGPRDTRNVRKVNMNNEMIILSKS